MDTGNDFRPPYPDQNGKHVQLPGHSPAASAPETGDDLLKLGWVLEVLRRRAVVMAVAAAVTTAIAGSITIINARKEEIKFESNFRLLVEPVTADIKADQLFARAKAGASATRLRDVEADVESSSLDYETQIRVLKSPQIINPVVEQLNNSYPNLFNQQLFYSSLVSDLEIIRSSYEQDGKLIGTKILIVKYQDPDPEKIKVVLSALADQYLKYSLKQRQTRLDKVIRSIKAQVPNLQRRVDVLQKQLKSLQEQYNLLDPSLQGRELSEQLARIQEDQRQVETELVDARLRYASLQKLWDEGRSAVILTLAGQSFTPLINQLYKIESEVAIESARLAQGSPPLRFLEEKRDNLRRLVRQEALNVLEKLAGEIEAMEAQEQTLLEDIALIKQKIQILPAVVRRYTNLQRELELATNTLNQFLEKRDTLKLELAQTLIPWEVLYPPGKPQPVSIPQIKRKLVLIGILSSLFGIGVGFLIELLHTVFHTPDEVQLATKLPLLGIVPFTKVLNHRKTQFPKPNSIPHLSTWIETKSFKPLSGNGKHSQPIQLDNTLSVNGSNPEHPDHILLLEAFRSLYTNIRLSTAEMPIHSIAIGSATPAEGKSTVAMYLSRTAAAMGQRVLLVDADLRCPRLHKLFNLSNEQGLSEVIAGGINLSSTIQNLPSEENIFVLTAGQVPPDPVKLLSSKKMADLTEQFRAVFDLTIYDTPPIMGLADSNLVFDYTDGMVLVVGLDKTDRSLVTKAIDGLRLSDISILGIVANGIKGYKPKVYATYRR